MFWVHHNSERECTARCVEENTPLFIFDQILVSDIGYQPNFGKPIFPYQPPFLENLVSDTGVATPFWR
jgi:hypothetical protein